MCHSCASCSSLVVLPYRPNMTILPLVGNWPFCWPQFCLTTSLWVLIVPQPPRKGRTPLWNGWSRHVCTLDRSRRWLLAIDSAAAGQEGFESGCPMTLLVILVKTRFLDNAAKRKQNVPDCFETFSTKSHCNYRCDRSEGFLGFWAALQEEYAKSPSNVAGYIRQPTP